MKLNLIHVDGEPIIWAHKSQIATVGGFVSVMGILPFIFLVVFPYAFVFQVAIINFGLDIYRTRKGARRWVDITRRLSFVVSGGFWRTETSLRQKQRMWAWDHFRGRRH